MAADTYTSSLGVILIGTGNDPNAWGANHNTGVFQIFEDAIANTLTTTAVTGQLGASNTLDLSGTPPPNGPSGARYATLVFAGAITANQTVKVPNLPKIWLVANQTSGAFTVSMKTPSGAAVAIPQNSGLQWVTCDGANDITVSPFNFNQIQMPDGSAALPAFSNVNENSSGWYRAGTQDWRLSINATDVLRVTGTGASSPSILNVLSPLQLQAGGSPGGLIPTGTEVPFAGVNAPSGWLLEYGQTVSRTTYSALFGVLCPTAIGATPITGNTHTNTTLDGLSVDLRGLGLVGAFVEGTGIQTGTTISSIASATSLTLSLAATGTATGITVRVLPYGQGDASTTFTLPDRRGRVLAGRDDMGGAAASRLTGHTSGILGTNLNAVGGEETHILSSPEMPSHTHTATSTVTDPGHHHTIPPTAFGGANFGGGAYGATGSTDTSTSTTGITVATTNTNTGGGGAHNNVQPAGISNMIIKS